MEMADLAVSHKSSKDRFRKTKKNRVCRKKINKDNRRSLTFNISFNTNI